MSSECLSSVRAFGGHQHRFQHRSQVLDCDMIYAVYLPPQAAAQDVPVVYYLSGLTCTDENFVTKAGAQRSGCRARCGDRRTRHQPKGRRRAG